MPVSARGTSIRPLPQTIADFAFCLVNVLLLPIFHHYLALVVSFVFFHFITQFPRSETFINIQCAFICIFLVPEKNKPNAVIADRENKNPPKMMMKLEEAVCWLVLLWRQLAGKRW